MKCENIFSTLILTSCGMINRMTVESEIEKSNLERVRGDYCA